jgi:hypothetical protein
MQIDRSDVEKLATLITKLTAAQKTKVSFSPNGDIIINITKEEFDSHGIFKGEPLPESNIHKKYKTLAEEDSIDTAINSAISAWCIEMRTKYGEIEWNSKILGSIMTE